MKKRTSMAAGLGLDVTNVLIESSGDLPSYIASGEAPVSCESTYTCTEMAAADVPMKMLTSTTDIGGTQGGSRT